MYNVFYSLLATKKQLRIIIILSLFDMLMTLIWVNAGLATEANPIMDYVLSKGNMVFATTKLGLTLGSVWLLHKFRKNILAKFMVPFISMAYLSIAVYHLVWLLRIF